MTVWCGDDLCYSSSSADPKCSCCSCCGVSEDISCWPSNRTLLLLRLWSMIFPPSDFRHGVMTPAMLLLAEYLLRCPVKSGRDVAVGSFICSLLLSVTLLFQFFFSLRCYLYSFGCYSVLQVVCQDPSWTLNFIALAWLKTFHNDFNLILHGQNLVITMICIESFPVLEMWSNFGTWSLDWWRQSGSDVKSLLYMLFLHVLKTNKR